MLNSKHWWWQNNCKKLKRPILSLCMYILSERIITQRQCNLAPNKSSSLHSINYKGGIVQLFPQAMTPCHNIRLLKLTNYYMDIWFIQTGKLWIYCLQYDLLLRSSAKFTETRAQVKITALWLQRMDHRSFSLKKYVMFLFVLKSLQLIPDLKK